MQTRFRGLPWYRLYAACAGLLWLSACGVSDIQLRDFAITTGIRTFYQTLGSALQAAIVGSFGG